ncbi:MAG: MBL fold metallo-hydrolase, partial [Myxococcota bacterium]|nr:MBL fold metallo-hydrolase [Myxococcota bacterium]
MTLEVRFWGVRGSIACPSPRHVAYGGNTSCLEVVA